MDVTGVPQTKDAQWAAALASNLAIAMQQGYDNPFDFHAICNVTVSHEQQDFSVGLILQNSTLLFAPKAFNECDAIFRITAPAAEPLLANLSHFDYRQVDIAHCIQFSGQQRAVDLLAASLVRTAPQVLRAFHRAQES